MINSELENKNRIEKERIRIYKKGRKCFHPFCKKPAIDSHVLQKNGFISKISENGHVYEHRPSAYGDLAFKFKRMGINEVFTFKGFCPYHDNRIFKAIETRPISFEDYLTNLLFAYRILAQEIIKKQQVNEWYTSLMHKKLVNSIYLQESISGNELGIKDCYHTLKRIIQNINEPKLGEFTFMSRAIEPKGICASGVYSFETTEEQLKMSQEVYKIPLTDIFVNILPLNEKSIVVIGYFNSSNLKCNNYIKDKFSLPNDKFVKFISDVLLAQMENWIISPTFYQAIKNDEDILSDISVKAINEINERFKIDYNLFDKKHFAKHGQ